MPKYHVWTIGCQMNKAESERLAALFNNQGYKKAERVDVADLILVNSCVVRKSAETKVKNKLQNLKAIKSRRNNVKIALTGCFVESDITEVVKRFPFIDHIFQAGTAPDWLNGQPMIPRQPQVSTYVPVMQGCDSFCTYCIVPYRRGRERSRKIEEVFCEAQELVRRGTKEVVLLGQKIDAYGKDLDGHPDLASLLSYLNTIQGLERIRFLTNYPGEVSVKLIEAMASLGKVCHHISLPLQSGDNEILNRMRRKYTVDVFRSLVTRLRKEMPDIAISTDVIIGFPGETQDQFLNTFRMIEELYFDKVHIASYSTRAGTLAALEYTDDVLPCEKRRRVTMIEDLQEKISFNINRKLLGKMVEVLVECKKGSKWQGRTRSDKLVFFETNSNLEGQLAKVRITHAGPWSLSGDYVA